MIERKFVANNVKEFQIKEFIKQIVGRVGLSDVKVQKTPLGEKIHIATSRPGLVVGRSGSNIAKITTALKKEFKLENPQIEIEEVKDIGLDANIIAEMIAGSLERFGSQRFKGVGHKSMSTVIAAGAYGVEILISGKIPSSRAKTWRFYQGYLKKCGDIAVSGVLKAYAVAKLKTGIVGIKVSIMPGTIKLPDKITLLPQVTEVIEEVKGSEAEVITEEIKTKAKTEVTKETSTKTTTKTEKKSESKSEIVKETKKQVKTVEDVKEDKVESKEKPLKTQEASKEDENKEKK